MHYWPYTGVVTHQIHTVPILRDVSSEQVMVDNALARIRSIDSENSLNAFRECFITDCMEVLGTTLWYGRGKMLHLR